MSKWGFFTSSLVWSAMVPMLMLACGGDDAPGRGSSDSGDSQSDGGADATTDGTIGSDDAGNDATLNDASDGASDDASDSTVSSDASDASDSAVLDAADAADTADAYTGLPCAVAANVGTIYYSRSIATGPNGEIWTIHGDGTADTMIGVGDRPRLSPDGQWMAFSRGSAGGLLNDLWVRELSTGTDTFLYANGGQYMVGYGFAADNATLYFDLGDYIDSIQRSGSDAGVFSSYLGYETNGYTDAPQVNLVDGRVAFHNFFDGLAVTVAADGGAMHIPNTIPGGYKDGGLNPAGDYWPTWTPDGQWIVFRSIATVGTGFWGSEGAVFKIRPDGSDRTVLTPTLASGEGFRWGGMITPDGTKLVAAGTFRGYTDIYTLALDGSGTIEHVCTSAGAPVDWVGSVTAP